MKVSITREYAWEMGHALYRHKGKCYNPHGHNYRMEVEVSGEVDKTTGMVTDFGDLDEVVKPIIEEHYDHSFHVNADDPRFNGENRSIISVVSHAYYEPTAERLAMDIHFDILQDLPEHLTIERLTLYETEKSSATVRNP
tara:strand:+ start:3453 stop:3872 length:420 start_codon:yes stop_codon:yes gene_type:complete